MLFLTAIAAAFLAILPKLIVASTLSLLSGSKCLDMIRENAPATPQNNKKSIKNASTARAPSGSLVLWNIDYQVYPLPKGHRSVFLHTSALQQHGMRCAHASQNICSPLWLGLGFLMSHLPLD